MQKILRKRIFRDLRENITQYFALGLMIVLGMFVVISMVSAADTIMTKTEEAAKKQKIEDGQFTLFSPLSQDEKKKLNESDVLVESHFYMDYKVEKDAILRVFMERKKIDLAHADQGRRPKRAGEVLMEKRYCEERGLSVGDTIKIGGHLFQICGIGTVPDYDAPYQNLSDSAINSKQFGLAILTKQDYEMLRKEEKSFKSEEYVYAYRLNGKMTEKKLKEKLQKFTIEERDIDDVYFKEYWDRTAGKLEDFKSGIEELSDGTTKLEGGLEKLNANNRMLTEGAGNIFDAFLKEASSQLEEAGIHALMRENYRTILQQLIENSGENALLRIELKSVLRQLEQLESYEDGTIQYTSGVSKAEVAAKKIANGMSKFSDEAVDTIEEQFDVELKKMTQFLPAKENIRIGAASDDVEINWSAGLLAGIILIVMFAYVISVFVVHTIEKEASVIGTLYALGVKQKELLLHYLILPVLVTAVAGIIGTLLGYSSFGVRSQMQSTYQYFSIPDFDVIYAPYLLLYGMVMPPVVAALTNVFVIRKKLKKPVLSMLRKEQKVVTASKIRLKDQNFVRTFQIRQFLREKRSAFTVFFGMFISLLVCMISVDCYALCENFRENSVADTKFSYMYTYKYPEENVPKGGEEAYGVTLKKETLGYNFDITLLGIHKDNPYFAAAVEKKQDQVWISSALAKKYQLKEGEELTLKDEENDRTYAFTIKGVVPYASGFFAFMDIDSMRELMGQADDYYNIVFSKDALKIENGRLYATTTKKEIKKSATIFTELMQSMVVMMAVVSTLIFVVVLYLMLKVMIERSASSISMLKVFGYRKKEIRRLYLNGNFLVVAVSALIGIPLSKLILNGLYPYLCSNVACGLDLQTDYRIYIGIFVAIIGLYFLLMPLLMRRINKILPAEILKERE